MIEDLEGTSHTITYGYDGRGLRVRRSEPPAGGGNSNRYFLYSPELQLLSITNDDEPNPWLRGPRVNTGAPSLRTQIIWFGGRPVAQVTDSELRFTFADHLGTPILQTTYTTPPEIQGRAEYEPFGNVYEMRQGNRIDQPLRFPGQEVAMSLEGQEENYNVFRWYRSGWGRYTQPDPLTMAGTALTELYTYAAANPVNSADPTGLVTVNQTFTRRGSLLGGGGNYTLAYSKVKATGTCVCSGGSNYIRLTLDFDHSYLCSGSACAIEQKHAEIASPFISRVAREWNQYEQVPYVSNAQCLADADYWAKDLERGILDGRRWPKDLLRRYNDAQNDYESTHHGWCATPGLPCAK
ncbi:MAG: RHS repeat-associated core domain-containing protein [Thermoanaerobaculia bacterium]